MVPLLTAQEMRDFEQRAIQEIDQAIQDIKRASIDDGKNLNDHPPVDGYGLYGQHG